MYRQTVLHGTSVLVQIRTQKAAVESQKRDSYSNFGMDKNKGVI